jgi:hypothetical protein
MEQRAEPPLCRVGYRWFPPDWVRALTCLCGLPRGHDPPNVHRCDSCGLVWEFRKDESGRIVKITFREGGVFWPSFPLPYVTRD